MTDLKKLIWAVDVLSEPEVPMQGLAFLRTLTARLHATLEPVYLLSPAGVRISPTRVPQWEEAFRLLAEKRMHDLVKSSEIPTALPGVVLYETDSSIRQAALRIVNHARAKRADAIVVSTHARKGLPRLFLGSFAETLLLQSDLPVITLNPNIQAPTNISHILFPTDFGQPSRRIFESTVKIAKQLGAKVTLFFKEPPIMIPPSSGGPVMIYDSYSEDELKQKKTLSLGWLEWAEKLGVVASAEIEERPGAVADAIIEYAAKKSVDLISMVAQSGPVSSVLLGSVSRQVVRNAPCPVWIRHTSER